MYAPLAVRMCGGTAQRIGDDLHWFTRALQPTLAYRVPPASAEATFVWVVHPAGGQLMPCWAIYTDGSLLDGPTPLLRRAGWAFVALDSVGTIMASAHGVPPPWISTIFGAETWAILQAVTHAPAEAALRIDCKSAVDLLIAGKEAAVRPTRLTSRAWRDIFAATGGEPPRDVSCMPAHTAAADVGCRRLGNGEFPIEQD